MISSHLTLFDPPFFTQSRNSLKICTLHNEADFVMRWQIEFWQFAFPSTSQNSWHISEMKNWVNPLRLDLINCNWILRFLVLKIEFDKLDFLSSLNWIFEGYTGSKNPVQTRPKIKLVKLSKIPTLAVYLQFLPILVQRWFYSTYLYHQVALKFQICHLSAMDF